MPKGTIMVFKILNALGMKENVHEPVCHLPIFGWSHLTKMVKRFNLVTITTKTLETIVFGFTCYCKTTISTYFSPLTD